MSYTIEVYRGNQKAERNLSVFALYVMYYPQLVAGPIERPQNILPQLRTEHAFDYSRMLSGLRQMLWGFFKKVVVADKLAYFVNIAFETPENYQGISLLIAAVFFSFQIFCDFSGYSDIAIGASRIMGIELMENFKRPYFSKTISEFWSRWHISLSTWFRDYLYIPLGGSRTTKRRWYFNLFVVFLISGFWHGASWTFIIWGALHGFYLIFGHLTSKLRESFNSRIGITKLPQLYKGMQIAIVFILVTMAWIFFRAETVQQGFLIIKKISIEVPKYFYNVFTNSRFLWLEPLFFNIYFKKIIFDVFIISAALILLEWVHFKERQQNFHELVSKKKLPLQWACYLFLIFFILIGGSFHSVSEFIYFQF